MPPHNATVLFAVDLRVHISIDQTVHTHAGLVALEIAASASSPLDGLIK